MKIINLEELSSESADTVTEVLDTITRQSQQVQVKRNGELLYDISRADLVPDNEPCVPQPGEKPSEVAERIFADGPLLDEKYQDISFEEFCREAWGGRGVR